MRKIVIFIINHLLPVAIIFNVILLFIPLPELLVDIGLILTWGFCMLLFFIVRNINEGFYTLPRKILYLTLLLLALEISYSRIIITFKSRIRMNPDTTFQFMYIINIILTVTLLVLAFRFVRKRAAATAEMAARFALDYMNQKFFDIDSKAMSGAITEEEAEKQKDSLRNEIDFYSNLDGASKLLTGNMKALIFMYVVSIAGGCLIGVIQYGYSIQSALNIVSLPALIAAICGSMCMTCLGACVAHYAMKITED